MSDTPRTDKAEYEVRLGKHRRMVVRPELARDLERELANAHAALLLAAEWGISSDGFSSEVAGNLRCWIIGGMKGPPPKAPDYYPKRSRDEAHH